MKVARGVWQRQILDSLLSEEGITSPYNRLRGEPTAIYKSKYMKGGL